MTLTPSERAWVLETERRANETALALQNVVYMFGVLCRQDVEAEYWHLVAHSQRELAAVSLAERVLRGVERIGEP